jgi:hypothetical protein
MKTVVTMTAVLMMLALALAPVGCCKPGMVPKVQGSLSIVQGFYDALLAKFLDNTTDAAVRFAIEAADKALYLAGKLQKEWCPKETEVVEAEKLAATAKAEADAVGIK